MPEVSYNSDIFLDFLRKPFPFSCYFEQTLVRKVRGTITPCNERDGELGEITAETVHTRGHILLPLLQPFMVRVVV